MKKLETLVSPHQLIRYPARPSADMSAHEVYVFNLAYQACLEVLEIRRGKCDEMYVVRLRDPLGGESGFINATAEQIMGDEKNKVDRYRIENIVAVVRETIN